MILKNKGSPSLCEYSVKTWKMFKIFCWQCSVYVDSIPDPAHQPQLFKGFNNLITVEYHQQQKTVNVNVHKVNAE